MQGCTFFFGSRLALAILSVTLLATSTWAASQEKVLHSFDLNDRDGNIPYGALISDAAGNLYGTTSDGGIYAVGTVFELSPREGGGWTETVLHSFGDEGSDGAFPQAALVFDSAGNLYGTTQAGGGDSYAGTVFELSPRNGGGWTEKVLHSFGNGADGSVPNGSLIMDAAGNLYGTTSSGGIHACDGFANNCGTVFELTPRDGGGWTERVLHSFGNGTDGYSPEASLIFDASGNLYGTTEDGGIHGDGAVFELTPRDGGSWTEKVLHSFGKGTDGYYPEASLIFDAAGNLYGTTLEGGIHGDGTVFELTPQEGGGWTEKVLHSFGNGTDGIYPYGDLILDTAGNLYSTTYSGGIHGYGSVFELIPRQDGGWTEQVLHSFDGTDGAAPFAGLIFDAAGNLYGTTGVGGIHGYGTAFEIMP